MNSKRVISVVLVALALAAAGFLFFKLRRFIPERPRGAELAPAGTVFFAQLPNLRQTALRVPSTDLYQIWREPDVEAFLEKPRQKAPWMHEWEQRFDAILRTAPGEVFLAVTVMDKTGLKFVAGFSYAGSRGDAEELLKMALGGTGEIISETADAHGMRIEKRKSQMGEIQSAFVKNWCFVATDATELEAVLERDTSPTVRADSLAADTTYQKTIAPLGAGQDAVFYDKTLATQMHFLLPANPAKISAVAVGSMIDGSQFRDRVFWLSEDTEQEPKLTRAPAALASPESLFYFTSRLGSIPSAQLAWLPALLPGREAMEQKLHEQNLTWADLPAAFDSELGVMADWPEDAALPGMVVAAEIRDRPKAEAFAAALAAGGAAAQGFFLVRPTMALTERFAVLGTNPEAMAAAVGRLKTPETSLAKSSLFQEATRTLPDKAVSFGYVDFSRAFERGYRMARPFITLSLAFSGEAGKQFDAGKLPPVEAISKHLRPSVIAESRTPEGTLVESTGTLTIPQLVIGTALAGAAEAPAGLDKMLPARARSLLPSVNLGLPGASPLPKMPTPADITGGGHK